MLIRIKLRSHNSLRDQHQTHLFIVLIVLAVEVRFECKFRSTRRALEAAGVEKCEVLQRSNPIDLIDDFLTPEAC